MGTTRKTITVTDQASQADIQEMASKHADRYIDDLPPSLSSVCLVFVMQTL